MVCADTNSFKKVFVTSTTYTGNLGGIVGADAKCMERAAAGGLTGTFKAWIANGTTAPATSMTHSAGPYLLVHWESVADNWTDLTDGSLGRAIDQTEFGDSLSGAELWSNVNNIGASSATSDSHCNNWTDGTSNYFGTYGSYSEFGVETWSAEGTLSCNSRRPLYCFQQ